MRAVDVDISVTNMNLFGTMDARLRRDNGLLAMLESYGVMVHPEVVTERTSLANPHMAFAFQTGVFQHYQWIRVRPENSYPFHPVTSRFAGLDLFWANPLSVAAPEGVEAEYLFTTTDEAWTMREPFFTSPGFAALMERDAHETAGRRVLGVSLSGIFPSWFDGRPLPEPLAGELPPMPEEPGVARIIVVGESGFATDFMNVTDFGDFTTNAHNNLNFLIHAADWLGHDDDIIAIRSRTVGSGRMDRIADPAARVAAVRFARTVNVFVMPILVVVVGIFVTQRRKAMARLRGEMPGGETGSDGE